MSVNTFLTSLAEDQGGKAVGVILSGFGSDGAAGIGAIKEGGGLTLSQAEFDHHAKQGMPQSAASSGYVDLVLPAEDMPAAMLEYLRHREAAETLKGPDGIRQDLPGSLDAICAVLHSRLGRDFSQYKAGTLMRRIQRRMDVLHTKQVSTYVEQLGTMPHEAELLFRELLISVTRFFRDHEAFEALEDAVIPGLAARIGSTDSSAMALPSPIVEPPPIATQQSAPSSPAISRAACATSTGTCITACAQMPAARSPRIAATRSASGRCSGVDKMSARRAPSVDSSSGSLSSAPHSNTTREGVP